jgi:hypothetical protein
VAGGTASGSGPTNRVTPPRVDTPAPTAPAPAGPTTTNPPVASGAPTGGGAAPSSGGQPAVPTVPGSATASPPQTTGVTPPAAPQQPPVQPVTPPASPPPATAQPIAPQPTTPPATGGGVAQQRQIEENAIRDVVRRYASAYTALRSDMVKEVYPGVDEPGLRRVFSQARRYTVDVVITTLDLNPTSTTAVVNGTWSVNVEPKVGTRREDRSAPVRLNLRKSGGTWIIVGRQE